MAPRELAKEIAYPLTDMTVLLGMAGFALLSALAQAAGILGLWLAILLVPAFFRYLLALLEARANGRPAPVAGIEMFNIADNFWTLAPLVVLATATWGGFLLAYQGHVAASRAAGLAFLAVLPASLAILAITRSPVESLNPLAWWRMMRACGGDYALAAIVPPLAAWLLSFLPLEGMPAIVRYLCWSYPTFLLGTLTGAALRANDVAYRVRIPDPVEPGEADVAAVRDSDRRKVLNHAYGFASRGNLDGALAHVRSAIFDDPEPAAARRWYFERMLQWESNTCALFFAQDYLAWLLAEGRDIETLKLLTRCFLEDPAFRPLPADREAAVDIARRFHRDDLLERIGV
jgi:hypothetical protein